MKREPVDDEVIEEGFADAQCTMTPWKNNSISMR